MLAFFLFTNRHHFEKKRNEITSIPGFHILSSTFKKMCVIKEKNLRFLYFIKWQ